MSNEKPRFKDLAGRTNKELEIRANQLLIQIDHETRLGEFDPSLASNLVKTIEELQGRLPISEAGALQDQYQQALDIYSELQRKANPHFPPRRKVTPAKLDTSNIWESEIAAYAIPDFSQEQVSTTRSAQVLGQAMYRSKPHKLIDNGFAERYLKSL